MVPTFNSVQTAGVRWRQRDGAGAAPMRVEPAASGRAPFVPMMEAPNLGDRHDGAIVGRRDQTRNRCVLVQRQVSGTVRSTNDRESSAEPKANGPPSRAVPAAAGCAAGPAVGAVTPGLRVGAPRATAPLCAGSGEGTGAPTSSLTSVSIGGRNINRRNENGLQHGQARAPRVVIAEHTRTSGITSPLTERPVVHVSLSRERLSARRRVSS
jgi:hypothetical protein